MKKNTNNDGEGGVITISDNKTGEVMVTEIYDYHEKEKLWNEWMRTAIEAYGKSPRKNSEMVIKNYHVEGISGLRYKNDKQVAFLMRNFSPDREIKILDAAFAYARLKAIPDERDIKVIIEDNKKAYRIFTEKATPLVSLLTLLPKKEETNSAVSISHAERIFRLKGYLSFLGKEKIRTPEDVAWIFRSLEQKGVEHAFFVLGKGDHSVILQAGIGTMNKAIIDTMGIIKAVNLLNADRITLVHNHPSGRVKASMEDMRMHASMKGIFGERLTQSVILNTNTGHYGVFNERYSEEMRFNNDYPAETMELPLLTFDTICLDKDYKKDSEWIIKSANEAAAFLTAQRFGGRQKMGYICVAGDNRIVGNFILTHDRLKKDNMRAIAREMVDSSISMNANRCILYGKGKELGLNRNFNDMWNLLNKESAQNVELMDCIELPNGNSKRYISSMVDGETPFVVYEKEQNIYEQIDIIRTTKGSNLIRVKVNGEFLPAEKLRKKDMERFENGTLSRDELAKIYFPTSQEENRDRLSR